MSESDQYTRRVFLAKVRDNAAIGVVRPRSPRLLPLDAVQHILTHPEAARFVNRLFTRAQRLDTAKSSDKAAKSHLEKSDHPLSPAYYLDQSLKHYRTLPLYDGNLHYYLKVIGDATIQVPEGNIWEVIAEVKTTIEHRHDVGLRNNGVFHNVLGRLYRDSGNFDAMEEVFKMYPNYSETKFGQHLNMARARGRFSHGNPMADFLSAQRVAVIEGYPRVPAYTDLADAYWHLWRKDPETYLWQARTTLLETSNSCGMSHWSSDNIAKFVRYMLQADMRTK